MSSASAWSESALSLSSIRETLIRLEDSIIFALIERAQFSQNKACYNAADSTYATFTGGDASLLDSMLLETERLHARVRRYTSPDEHAFFPNKLPTPALPLIDFPEVLRPNLVNLNSAIMDMYLSKVLPELCREGDDGQHGSTVVADIAVLQAISKRVHYGFFVAEAKFRAQTDDFTRLIEAGDEPAIMGLLTHAKVEEKVLLRVRLKAATFGQEIEAPPTPEGTPPPSPAMKSASSGRVDPDLIMQMYHDHVIPLTKVAEVEYLMQRLTPAAVAHHGEKEGACSRAARDYFEGGCPTGAQQPRVLQCPNAADVFAAVMSNRAYHGVALLEVGDSGILSATRLLLRDNNLVIVGELVHASRFQLISRAEHLQNIRKVIARPEVHRICKEWLLKELGGRLVDNQEVPADPDLPSTLWRQRSDDASGDSSGGSGAADATTAWLVETHSEIPENEGLRVLSVAPSALIERAICVVLAKRSRCGSSPTGRDKTMVCFSLYKDRVGGLAEALAVLTRFGVNLLSIRSYVDLQDATRVDFVVSCVGHEHETHVEGALRELHGHVASLKVLGSYAVAKDSATLS